MELLEALKPLLPNKLYLMLGFATHLYYAVKAKKFENVVDAIDKVSKA